MSSSTHRFSIASRKAAGGALVSHVHATDQFAITAAQNDVFTYSIIDKDGDVSTTTLTINITNVTLVADNEVVTVNERATGNEGRGTRRDERSQRCPIHPVQGGGRVHIGVICKAGLLFAGLAARAHLPRHIHSRGQGLV